MSWVLQITLITDHGKIVEQGSYDDLMASKQQLFELMKNYQVDKKKEEEAEEEKVDNAKTDEKDFGGIIVICL